MLKKKYFEIPTQMSNKTLLPIPLPIVTVEFEVEDSVFSFPRL